MKALTAYIIVILLCIYWLKEKAGKYKTRDEIITNVVVATFGGAFGNLVAEIGNSATVKKLPDLYGGIYDQ